MISVEKFNEYSHTTYLDTQLEDVIIISEAK